MVAVIVDQWISVNFDSFQVQTGFGRTGDHFWGFQGHGVMPDIGKHKIFCEN